jgi:hypothetical protein
MSDDNNSIPGLLELLLRVAKPSSKSAELDVFTELRISSATLDAPDGLVFTVALKRAWLSLDLLGLDPVPGSRLGEPAKPNEVTVKQKMSQEVVRKNEIGGHVGAKIDSTGASAGLELGAKHSSAGKTVVSTTSVESKPHIRVKARGNLMWEITDSPQLGELDGTYLNNESLCRTRSRVGANARTVQLLAYAKQRDILLRLEKGNSRFSFPSLNHEKMMKILIAKAISAPGTPFNGIVEFSKSESDVED